MPGYTFAHLGINAENREEALKTVEVLCMLFGLSPKIPEKGSPYAGKNIEVIPAGKDGKNGHIAFYTGDIFAAMQDMESRGIELDYTRVKRNSDGTPYLIYLKQELCGFAIHLLGDKKG